MTEPDQSPFASPGQPSDGFPTGDGPASPLSDSAQRGSSYPQQGQPQRGFTQPGYSQSGYSQPGSRESGQPQPGQQPHRQYPGGAGVWGPAQEPMYLGSQPNYGVQRPVRTRAARAGKLGFGSVCLVIVLALVAGGTGGFVAGQTKAGKGASVVEVPVVSTPQGPDRPAESVAGIARAVTPSVVSLEVVDGSSYSTGSGFVFSADGYILTNNHVVAASKKARITVLLSDGSKEPATVVGTTQDYDLAVVKIDRTGLQPLTLGDSDAVVVGDPVIAIGAPLGLDGTVTTGIVSALNRPVVAGGDADIAFINAIQTDAAINPGNSGGPLVNSAGEVIGINSAIAQPPGSAQATGSIGLGFSIPSNQAKRTAAELIETGKATYPLIGVLLDSFYDGEGVMVLRNPPAGQTPVTPGSAAERAGLQSGDVILAFDGRPVTEPNELIVAIRARAPGDTVVLTIRADGTEKESEVHLVLDEAVSK